MHIGHDPVVVADARGTAALHRTAVDGTEFTDDVTVADLEQRRFPVEFFVLGNLAYGGELKDLILPPDAGGTVDDRMGTNPAALADNHVGTDDGIGPYLYVGGQFRSGVNDGTRIDQISTSLCAHMRSALATTLPSTLASPLNFQTPRTARSNFTSRIS